MFIIQKQGIIQGKSLISLVGILPKGFTCLNISKVWPIPVLNKAQIKARQDWFSHIPTYNPPMFQGPKRAA